MARLPVFFFLGGWAHYHIRQVQAIIRYLAAMVPGLIPADPLDAAEVDGVFQAAEELTAANPVVNVFRGGQWAEKKRAYFEETLPRRLDNIVLQLERSGGPFMCGKTPRYCDFAMYHQVRWAAAWLSACA